MNSSWATQDPPGLLWFEQTDNAAVYIGGIAYGIHIAVFFMCTHYMIQEGRRSNLKWFAFISVLFASGTINICMNMHYAELAWIDERDYPGGPLAFLLQQESLTTATVGNSASIIATFLAQGLLIIRVHIVWRKWYILVIPVCMWLASAAMSALFTTQAALPNSSIWANGTRNFAVPFWSLSMSLNILLTILLAIKLLYMRRIIVATIGPQHGKMYTDITAMIIECALPYALVSLVFIVLYGIGNTAETLFLPLLAQVECITPMLVLLRVARGRAWSHDTISQANLSSVRFNNMDVSETIGEIQTVGVSDHFPKTASNPTLRNIDSNV
ncbi:hypothetical protein CERSUDRAFT_124979 [Gelatoporia subvermispora B]|uniref:Uncharacterized protein n=1 Tax=Ceriporiopsis subvermispora (strain B) TaxID=914234 RepID=M2R8F9_CERS8|nr:hypothetical protein CERSUDRAFT_124979 [Gelatoporia subvermispora B]